MIDDLLSDYHEPDDLSDLDDQITGTLSTERHGVMKQGTFSEG
jgi:hypothetical protein